MKKKIVSIALLFCLVISNSSVLAVNGQFFGEADQALANEQKVGDPKASLVNPTPINQVFPDAAMAAAVAGKLSKSVSDSVTQTELDTITILTQKSGVSNLEGMQYLTQLTSLDLGNNQTITSIAPLAGLTNLTNLSLFNNQVSDISPLANLTNLTDLNLAYNQITNVAPLANLTNLKSLVLYNNEIIDVSSLSGLTKLEYLNLHNNQIVNVAPLSGLANLEILYLATNQITDITPLSGLTNLANLDLTDNDISDVTPITNLTSLTELRLSENTIADITPLAGLTNLEYLFMQSNQITDITPLSNLTNLVELSMDSNQITSMTPVANMTKLEYLNFNNNQVSDITALTNLVNLENLKCWNNQITDITPLANMSKLTMLEIGENQITDITSLASLTELQQLALNHNQISNIAPLANLTKLWNLNFGHNQISDVTPLANLTALGSLNASYNQISDITPLRGLANLNHLTLDNNQISDITPLAGLSNLATPYLEDQLITLPAVTYSGSVSIANMVKNDEGQLVAPAVISNNGSYTAPNITWIGLTDQTQVDYTFSQDVTVGRATTEFSGKVIQPLTTDTTVPTITAEDVTYEKGISKTEAEYLVDAKATSEAGAVISSDFATAVDLNKVGIYSVNITAIDAAGNKASVQVKVTVEDTTAPSITAEDVTYEKGISKTEAEYLIDANVVSEVGATITSDFASVVNLNKVGTYDVTITATDAVGNKASIQVKVNVVDTVAPVITAEDVTYERGISKTEAAYLVDANATSEAGAIITSDFTSAVELNKVGTYDVIITATDAAGNKASVQVKVHIKDTIAPVIIAEDVTYDLGIAKTEAEYLVDANVVSEVDAVISSDFAEVVNLNKVGTYVVTITATDAENNQASIQVNVYVKEMVDPEKPDPEVPGTIDPENPSTPEPESPVVPKPVTTKPSVMPTPALSEPIPHTGDNGAKLPIALLSLCIGMGLMIIGRKNKSESETE